MDTTFFIQAFAVLLFAVTLIHCWRTEGPRPAQQWFLIGYLFALLAISLLVVVQQIAYNANMVVFGAAPSLTVMLFPAVFYIAYAVSRMFVDPTDLRAMGYLMLVLTPWILIPLDALAISQHWWSFPTESYEFLDGIPFYIPFAWGYAAAAFFLMIGRIRKIRFRGNGQFFAMIIATPLIAALSLLVIALIQVVLDTVAALGGMITMYALLALFLVLMPLALVLNIPRLQIQEPLAGARDK